MRKRLPGREQRAPVAARHFVLGTSMQPPFPGMRRAIFGMGCFWGAERLFWQQQGVHSTAVGYAGGSTRNPTYEEVCAGLTGHAEVVHVVYDPERTNYEAMLRLFFEGHDPTQGMRQGNDVGEQYRSAVYCLSEMQLRQARSFRDHYARRLAEAGRRSMITSEIAMAGEFYFAEDEHQQYLAKNPHAYCGLGGTGVSCG